eukprot:6242850-Alexandrium_andersonii.AAC.1
MPASYPQASDPQSTVRAIVRSRRARCRSPPPQGLVWVVRRRLARGLRPRGDEKRRGARAG